MTCTPPTVLKALVLPTLYSVLAERRAAAVVEPERLAPPDWNQKPRKKPTLLPFNAEAAEAV